MLTNHVFDCLRVRVLLLHDGKLLMNAPGGPPGQEPYRCLPGGGLEPNESLYEVAEREVREETGLSIRVTSVAFLREWVTPKHVPREAMIAEAEAWGYQADPDQVPECLYGLEVYVWGELLGGDPTNLGLKDGRHPPAEWLPLQQIEGESLYPPELRALARDLFAGRAKAGVPCFLASLSTPHAKPSYGAFHGE